MAMFIAKATANSHGQFRAKAQKAGMSTAAFARQVLSHPNDHDAETKKQAVLAQNLMKAAKGRKKSASPSTPTTPSTPPTPSAPPTDSLPPMV